VPKRVARSRRRASVFVGAVGAITAVALVVGALVARSFTTVRSTVVALAVVSILVAAAGGFLLGPYLDRLAGGERAANGQPVPSSAD
jgi:hypothetical protein